jgi:hypothetical protein
MSELARSYRRGFYRTRFKRPFTGHVVIRHIRITETSDDRVTESDDTRVTERSNSTTT